MNKCGVSHDNELCVIGEYFIGVLQDFYSADPAQMRQIEL